MKMPLPKPKNQSAKAKLILRGHFLDEISTDPFLDWMIIMIINILIVLTLVGVGVSVYLGTVATLSAPPPDAPRASIPSINTNALQSVLDEFARRSAERSDPANSYRVPKDPSLP